MRLTVLCENTAARDGILSEHGLSLYIEAQNHKILFDTGQTDVFYDNAKALGIDIGDVDIAILSHGHYDHGGGIRKFLEINDKANVYVSRLAFGHHYNGREKYIGLDKSLENESRLVLVGDSHTIDKGLSLDTCNNLEPLHNTPAYGLERVENGVFMPDTFRHEQYLTICEANRKIVVSGCSHKGVLNIMHWLRPRILVGGFHFTKLSPGTCEGRQALKSSAEELLKYDTKYYTGHCTGTEQFEFLKEIMGSRVQYISAGRTLIL